ncbi:unnamed protein product [Fusarium venenatum]|uniref:Uncharacterized protein n=1 Tax=Fusarium venenatum TaxID=56646 RepID=A0A2L2TAU7_9HYPO|nr:uncharacterized protein FVRRES_08159 [Fusarium venenatum]CEI68082.1 unnamed protein product [Fusarium venenatum]
MPAWHSKIPKIRRKSQFTATAHNHSRIDWRKGICDPEPTNFAPLTCFVLGKTHSMESDLRDARLKYSKEDDVFCDEFLKTILILTDNRSISESVQGILSEWGCTSVFLQSRSQDISPGPYFFSSRGIYSAWRLYSDDHDAFVLSTTPSQTDCETYENMNASAFGLSSLCIAVPSRMKFQSSNKQPLAGLRIGVKDLFHLKGAHTGCGNRAYRRLHPAQEYSTERVKKVVDLGGIIVGKTKTVEFGGSQEVIGDWCDYFYAFNARGDGYFASTGSSTGSAASLAAYPWLDVTLGTDSGGSIRDPAVAHGIYGFRPSHDGREATDMVLPCGILFPKEYHLPNSNAQAVVDGWVTKLASWLQAESCDVSIEDIWNATKPVASSESFFETFKKTFITLTYRGFWIDLASFRDEYRNKFHENPYVCKVLQALWDLGKSLSPEEIQQALDEIVLHNTWFFKNILNDQKTIIVAPRYALDYRDEYLPYAYNVHISVEGIV